MGISFPIALDLTPFGSGAGLLAGHSIYNSTMSHHTHHHHHTRRDFFHRMVGGAMTGASVLEMGFFRAAVARAQAPAANPKLFDIQKVADGVFAALARPQALTNSNAAIFVNSQD